MCPSSSVRHHSPFDGGPTSKMSSSKSFLLVFHPFVLNHLLPSHVSLPFSSSTLHSFFFVPYRLGWPPASLSLSPLVAWSCTLAIHLPPLLIQMSQYVPGTMKVQLESHVVVQLRISPLINKMSDRPLLFCSLSFSLSYFIIGMWEIYINAQQFMWASCLLCQPKYCYGMKKKKKTRIDEFFDSGDPAVGFIGLMTSQRTRSDFYEDWSQGCHEEPFHCRTFNQKGN